MKYTHLHVHSHYSVLDGMSKVPELVDKCLRTGMDSIALTDHGNMYGIKELLDYCKEVNKGRKKAMGDAYYPFKPIVGVEAYCARRGRHSMTNEESFNYDGRRYVIDRSGWHLILLAKNRTGYQSLCKIVSLGFYDDAFNYTSRIDKDLLTSYHDGLICCSACLGGEVSQKVMEGLTAWRNSRDIFVVRPDTLTPEILDRYFGAAQETVKWFKSLFGDDYYLEIQRHETQKPGGEQSVYEKQQEVNPVLLALSKRYGVKVICTNDVHFVEEEHSEAHDRLICLSTNHNIDDADRMHYTKQEWLKSPEEMEAIFSDIPEALVNTQEIADKVEIYDIDSDPIMPLFPIPETFGTEADYRCRFTEQSLFDEFTQDENGKVVLSDEEAEKKIKKLGGYERLYRIKFEADYLAHLTWDGAMRRYPDLREDIERIGSDGLYEIGWDCQGLSEHSRMVVERIKFELHVMKTMGFPGYFLIVMDFIRGAREELGVSVGPGRGSAAGSVVAYCLHITDLDPLKYDLLFERFLNPDRISLPDIDTDFDDAGRGKVLEWVSEKYGRTHVAHIITYGTMAAKSAIADVGRIQRIPLSRVSQIKSLIPEKGFPDSIKDEKGKSPKVNLKNCYKYVDELKELLNGTDVQISSMLNYAEQLEDTIRQVGIHACGVIIGADDLTKYAPLSSVEDKESKKRVLVTEYDGHVIESVGLIKMDFLGLKTLTIIKECLEQIRRARGEEVDIDHIPLDDDLTYQLFKDGRTVAVFQFESAGMKKYLRELQPNVITDLIAMNALYRPGPLSYIPSFIKRKHGQEEIKYDIPCMDKYLKDTYGITVYQEQVMLLSRQLAGFTRGESDALRKAMGKKKKEIVDAMKPKFIEGGVKNGHDPKVLEKIWGDWEAFASYAFNKSHAACYAWVAYQTAYLKAHYPAEFMAANLTIFKDDIKEVTKFMDECKAMKINVLEPDVNESDLNFTVNSHGDIRFGLGGVKGIGESAVDAILTERSKNGKYSDIYDFVERVNLQACNRKTIESLAQSGAFDSFENLYREQILGYNEKSGECMLDLLIRFGNVYQQDKQQQQNSLFGDLSGEMTVNIQKPELPQAPKMSTIERLNIEKNMIGIYLSAHPLDDYEFEVSRLSNITAEELARLEGWRSPSSRKASANNGEDGEKTIDPNQWIREKENKILHLGGIITDSLVLTSQKGNKYGKYVLEDYSGAFSFVLFGSTFENMGHLLQVNDFVYLTCTIQQRGAGYKYFTPKAPEEADYELSIQQVDRLKDAQNKYLHHLVLNIPLTNVDEELVNELHDQCESHAGKTELRVNIKDEERQNQITFVARTHPLKIDKELYHWLKIKEMEGKLSLEIG